MELQSLDAEVAAEMKYDKRFRMYAQDFYCPLVSGDYERGPEQLFQCKSAPSELLESNGLFPSTTATESVHDGAVVSDLTSSQDVHVGVQVEEIRDDSDIVGIPKTGRNLIEAELVKDAKTEEVILTEDAPPKPNLGYFHVEPVRISPPPPVETSDTCTNTSQPLFADIAIGHSQPEMMEASTGMSQKEVSTSDCGIQTSQELYFQTVPQSVPPNEASTSACKKPPIVFPRVRCQTSAPEIPAKIPRLSELDQEGRITLNPIYSSAVTFEFNDEESDKENDPSILRQRGNVRNLMKKESNYLFPSPSKVQEPDVDENDENVPRQAQASSSGFSANSSRGPFLRVGLSKKRRVPKPLHPRTFDWE